jgi:hypothetical protein
VFRWLRLMTESTAFTGSRNPEPTHFQSTYAVEYV